MRARLPRVRVRLWWMMVAVAIAGLALAATESLRRRRAFASAMADHHDVKFNDLMYSRGAMTDFRPLARPADYHLKMMEKWRHAARYPWLPVEPDPPPPD